MDRYSGARFTQKVGKIRKWKGIQGWRSYEKGNARRKKRIKGIEIQRERAVKEQYEGKKRKTGSLRTP